jgi:hypothetical protein
MQQEGAIGELAQLELGAVGQRVIGSQDDPGRVAA